MLFARCAALLACVIALQSLPAQATSSDDAEVRRVVDRYLYGLKHNDITAFKEAFRPDAKLLFVKGDGTMGELTQEKWYEGFAPVAGKVEDGELRIASVEVTRDAASVKVVEEYPKSRYTDYLSLLKLQGRWWIVNKIYTSERKGG
jgi:uncharacterized protein (TIGR02246 family)